MHLDTLEDGVSPDELADIYGGLEGENVQGSLPLGR